mgnify:CR=1 FL=1
MNILAFESSCDETAAALYASLGFAQIGLRKNYYQHPKEDARILRKELL